MNGEWVDMEIRYEIIRIHKQEEPCVLRVRHTRHEPISADLPSWEKLGNFFLPEPGGDFPGNIGFTALALRYRNVPAVFVRRERLMDRMRSIRARRFWKSRGTTGNGT